MEVENEGGNMEGRGRLYLLLHCRHQNDSCIKTGSDDSHFNVSLIVRDKVIRKCPPVRGITVLFLLATTGLGNLLSKSLRWDAERTYDPKATSRHVCVTS